MRYVWYSLYAFVTALALYALFFTKNEPAPVPSPPPPIPVEEVTEDPKPVVKVDSDVQIALLLDTSSSMDGLIEQARTQLWEIVGEMQLDDDDSDRTVSVALYQYGNNRLSKRGGYIQQMAELTTDLDAVSIKLQSLRTSGGKEYAPMAIDRAVSELAWDDDDSVEKLIVIAGNEGFRQGPVSARNALAAAQKKGITVIPIFCANGGSSTSGLATWRTAAKLANTDLETIDPDKVVAKLDTPYDAEIVKKYQQLQECSLTYGSDDYRRQVKSQRAQASSYVQSKGVALQAERAVVQSRQRVSGDLLDGYEGGSIEIGAAAPSALPAELRGKSKDEQEKIVKNRLARKKQLQREIQELNLKRTSYTQSKMKEVKAYRAAGKSTLGSSVRARVRKGQVSSY